MMNLIKMDLFRLFKSKNTYMTLLFVIVFTGILFAMSASFGSMTEAPEGSKNAMATEISTEQAQAMKRGEAGIGFVMSEFTSETPMTLEKLLTSFLSSGFFLIFSGIFITNVVCDKYKCGFQKNLNTYGKKKWQIILSENVSLFVFAAMQIILVVITSLIISVLYFDDFSVSNWVYIIRYIGMHILMHYAFATLIMCFAELLRGKIVCITLSCLFSMGIGGLVMNKLDSIFEFENFSFAKSIMDYHVKLMPFDFDAELWGHAICIVIFSMIVYNAISSLIVSHRDLA